MGRSRRIRSSGVELCGPGISGGIECQRVDKTVKFSCTFRGSKTGGSNDTVSSDRDERDGPHESDPS